MSSGIPPAAFMIDEGGDPLQVMRRMGHSDIRTTYNLYGHLFPDREDELVGKLDRRYRRTFAASIRAADPTDLRGHVRISLGRAGQSGPEGAHSEARTAA